MRLPRLLLLALLAAGLLLAGPTGTDAATKTKKKSEATSATKSKNKKGGTTPKSTRKKSRSTKKKVPVRRISPGELLASLRPVPVDSPQALGPFFEALRALESEPGPPGPDARAVRVLHFGDSHVAADIWTGELRALLQGRFGDAGPGFVMPGNPWKYFRHSRAKSLGGKGWQRCGLRDDPCQGLVGLGRASLRPTVPRRGKLEPAGLLAQFRYCEVQWALPALGELPVTRVDGRPFLPPGTGPPPFEVPGGSPPPGSDESAPVPGEEPWLSTLDEGSLGPADWSLLSERLVEPLSPGLHRIELMAGGDARLLGADLLSGEPGILVDALGINGSEITDLEAWWPSVRPSLLNHAAPALLIVSFGTNDMGAKGFDEAAYRETSMRVLRSLRADAPGATVLVTAPFDRGGKSRKSRALMQERSQRATAALRDAARETGCAFWDAREAMGGAGSMPRWASARLAQRDQVHLTEPGYRQMAHYLFDALMKAFEGWEPKPPPSPTQESP